MVCFVPHRRGMWLPLQPWVTARQGQSEWEETSERRALLCSRVRMGTQWLASDLPVPSPSICNVSNNFIIYPNTRIRTENMASLAFVERSLQSRKFFSQFGSHSFCLPYLCSILSIPGTPLSLIYVLKWIHKAPFLSRPSQPEPDAH